MITEKAEILSNSNFKGDYCKIVFYCPNIIKKGIAPGQFAHVEISGLKYGILRRPFSIFDVNENGTLSIIYKVVGKGTLQMSGLKVGDTCNILGPLGNNYSLPGENEIPVLVAGGYGSAAMYLIAKNSTNKGVLLLGARNEGELILEKEYKELGFQVMISTDDGSKGHKGLVTELMDELIQSSGKNYVFYGCGPNPMMYAMAKKLVEVEKLAEISLDHHMCCGVGGCYTCVVKVKDGKGGWKYVRSCKEGPVFNIRDVYLGE